MNEYIDFHDYRAVIESEEISAKISGIGGGVVPMLETSEEVAREQPT